MTVNVTYKTVKITYKTVKITYKTVNTRVWSEDTGSEHDLEGRGVRPLHLLFDEQDVEVSRHL